MSVRPVTDLSLGHLRLDEAHADVPVDALGAEYGTPAGALPLREAIAHWQRTTLDRVAVTTGASLGLAATFATLPRGASVLVPRPRYPAYAPVAAAFGLDVVSYDLDPERRWQPGVESVGERLDRNTRAIVVNQPHNPTGSVAEPEVLRQIRAVCGGREIVLVSDETYSGILFDGAPLPDMHAIFGGAGLVRVLSFSKLFGMPGERLGCVIADPERLSAICRMHWLLAMSPPATAQVIALSVLRTGPEQHVRGLVRALARNRAHAIEMLGSEGRLVVAPPAGGCFLWIRVMDCPLDSRTFARRCHDDHGVHVAAGASFGVDDPVYVRASFAVPPNELTEGLRRLAGAVHALDRPTRRPHSVAAPSGAAA
jgi:aspartate/methionine/tyrosine aminotransferase